MHIYTCGKGRQPENCNILHRHLRLHPALAWFPVRRREKGGQRVEQGAVLRACKPGFSSAVVYCSGGSDGCFAHHIIHLIHLIHLTHSALQGFTSGLLLACTWPAPAGKLLQSCRKTATEQPQDCRQTGRKQPGNCRTTATKLPKNCRETAGELPQNSHRTAGKQQENCRKTATELQENCRRTATELQESCR